MQNLLNEQFKTKVERDQRYNALRKTHKHVSRGTNTVQNPETKAWSIVWTVVYAKLDPLAKLESKPIDALLDTAITPTEAQNVETAREVVQNS